MSQKFTPLAQSRASYYCKGSPVHFVMVELFRMEGTGATVVTLTFKNLFSRPLVSFTAYFRCKNKYGEVVVEDSFTYDNVYAGEGECFGFDDAVFVSDEPLGSVEVRLGSVTYDDGAPHDLRRCPAVALPALRLLARGRSSPTGKSCSSRIFNISRPTAPVAPKTATLYSFIPLSLLQ